MKIGQLGKAFINVAGQKLKESDNFLEDIHKSAQELLKMIAKQDFMRDSYSLREMMDWFMEKQELHPTAEKGAAILKENSLKGSTIILSLLDSCDELFEENGKIVASQISCREIDQEILKHFDNKKVIIFE